MIKIDKKTSKMQAWILSPKLCKKAERETVKYLRSKPVDIN